MREEELSNLKNLFEQVEFAPTKIEAAPILKKLEFSCSSYVLEPRAKNTLSKALSYAKSAAGQVSEKEHWVKCMKETLLQFEREVKN
jgi:hypothetical protein